jgi:ELWxxDGT repeat protein
MKTSISLISSVFIYVMASAQQPFLLKDINPLGSSMSSYGSEAKAVFQGNVYFIADNGTKGSELWKTNGTSAGTVMVKDINPSGSSMNAGFAYVKYFCEVNGFLYFVADDSTHGRELWKTDGTGPGTVLVKDINPGLVGSSPQHFSYLSEINGKLVFNADDGIHGNEPWKSDGTGIGTSLLLDINTTSDVNPVFCNSSPNYFTPFNGNLFFYAGGDGVSQNFWKTDGTTAGTALVHNISPSGQIASKSTFEEMNGLLYMTASDFNLDAELWKSEGTGPGTSLIKNISVNSTSACGNFTNVNGTLFFSAIDDLTLNGEELWKSNGTAGGTVMVKDIKSGQYGSAPHDFISFNGTLFFGADDGIHGDELWKSDGTTGGTVMVKDINTGIGSSYVNSIVISGGDMYFAATDANNDTELWKSDGSPGGTVLVANINATGSSNPVDLIVMNNSLYFSADNGTDGQELYRYDLSTDLDNNSPNGNKYKFSVFPNPVTENAVIALNPNFNYQNENLRLRLTDVLGREAEKISIRGSGNIFQRNDLPSGVYFCELINDTETLAKSKIIILDR